MELYLVVCCFDNLFSIVIHVAAEDAFEQQAKVLRYSVQYPVSKAERFKI